jgi:hypothetical protein
MADLAAVWGVLEGWDQERPKILQLADCRVRLYMGAMAIPMVAVQPPRPIEPSVDRMDAFVSLLQGFALELDCVEVGGNYKINRSETKEYVGRILPDALKLHAERILDIGEEAFESMVTFYLALPPAAA